MPSLGTKQREFTLDVAKLIFKAYELGYELTFAEAYRSPEQAALNAKNGTGITNSLHTLRLAVDLNLFKDGKYLQTSEAHLPLGEYWESLRVDNCWGGRFTKPDGNHYSRTHNGLK